MYMREAADSFRPCEHEFRSVPGNYGLFNTVVERLSYRAGILQEVVTMKTKTGVKAGNSSYFVEWIPNN